LTDLLSFGAIRPSTSGPGVKDPTRSLRLSNKAICEELLPEVIGLTDAFGFTDWDLDRYKYFLTLRRSTIIFTKKKNAFSFSALGVYDGKVYEALWERAKAEPLNRTEVPVAYEVRDMRHHSLLLMSISFTRVLFLSFFSGVYKASPRTGEKVGGSSEAII